MHTPSRSAFVSSKPDSGSPHGVPSLLRVSARFPRDSGVFSYCVGISVTCFDCWCKMDGCRWFFSRLVSLGLFEGLNRRLAEKRGAQQEGGGRALGCGSGVVANEEILSELQ